MSNLHPKINDHPLVYSGPMSTLYKDVVKCIKCERLVDFRQKIADSWPDSLDDSLAKKHWNWKAKYDLKKMTVDMLKNLKKANQIK